MTQQQIIVIGIVAFVTIFCFVSIYIRYIKNKHKSEIKNTCSPYSKLSGFLRIYSIPY